MLNAAKRHSTGIIINVRVKIMNEAMIKQAAEKFEAVIREQLERVERMKAEKDFIDYDSLDKHYNRRLRRRRNRPVITREAERVLKFLLADDVEAGKVEFKEIDGLTIEHPRRGYEGHSRRCAGRA